MFPTQVVVHVAGEAGRRSVTRLYSAAHGLPMGVAKHHGDSAALMGGPEPRTRRWPNLVCSTSREQTKLGSSLTYQRNYVSRYEKTNRRRYSSGWSSDSTSATEVRRRDQAPSRVEAELAELSTMPQVQPEETMRILHLGSAGQHDSGPWRAMEA